MILVNGGTGFLGSHTCVALAQAGHDFLILDNLSNSRADVLDRLAPLCGRRPAFVHGDVRDAVALERVFAEHPITASLKASLGTRSSMKKPAPSTARARRCSSRG